MRDYEVVLEVWSNFEGDINLHYRTVSAYNKDDALCQAALMCGTNATVRSADLVED